MIPMGLAETAAALGAGCAPGHESIPITRVATDSREVEPGDLFFAIRGERS